MMSLEISKYDVNYHKKMWEEKNKDWVKDKEYRTSNKYNFYKI